MNLRGILSVAAVSAALLGSATGCGVKGGDEITASGATETTAGSTTTGGGSDKSATTEPESTETTETGGADEPTTQDSTASTSMTIPGDFNVRDAMIDAYVSAGFNREQATCLADEMEKMGMTDPNSSGDVNPTDILSIFDRCHISMADLGKLGTAGG